ncbi:MULTISPECIES: lycopene cyclase family protein [Flavobacteriaceae]|uniref:lycopene cyclase family protein n=1 Tax=Flavobacteriaceae TaxID=49546 RepID=UPI001490B0B4|nr:MULTISPECIES: lycopene cyclase family protein [Allomuricauda]MDC6366281.1 lycopene cyclase family protein [Muricauda sp. AC10]
MSSFDYIILGAGAAGLLLADSFGKDDFFVSKSILILDKDSKNKNDRTWCFWEKNEGEFDHLTHKVWNKIYFAGNQLQLSTNILPYSYKMLRGIDFYNHYVHKIKTYSNVTWIQDSVTDVIEHENDVQIITAKENYRGKTVFTSIFDSKPMYQQKKFPVLQQHFLGWFIKTETPVFDQAQATFMDFSILQKGNTRFMYVLPFSKTEALVEYTLFSENLLEKADYETAIKDYLKEKFENPSYEIVDTEKGSIPMTCYPFHHKNTSKILHIGVAGGWAKPSTGFTFYNTHKQVIKLVEYLKHEKPLTDFHQSGRFWFYDLLLLDILHRDNSSGRSIFESMFKKRKASLILKFLENETTFWEDLKIISACPKLPFLKALWNRVF